MLDTAEAVMEKYGVEGITVARVARHAGLAPSNVYRRFRGKDALIAAVFNRFTEINARELAARVDPEQIRRDFDQRDDPGLSHPHWADTCCSDVLTAELCDRGIRAEKSGS